ncbi:MAG TPA: hypothetical protein VMT18_06495, partial [Planctomycetota bacterium]|nr:hypothetical protein [Planctomycetota bacterium]
MPLSTRPPNPRLALAALAFASLLGGAHAQTVVTWSASSGEFPEAPCWTLVDSADPEQPLLQNGALELGTSANAENLYYQWQSKLTFPSTFVFEARVRWLSGSSSTPVRAPVTLSFTMAPLVGNALFIDQDEIFVLASNTVKGASAVVDTDDAFHTYRIEVTGTTAGSSVEVYYDGEATPRLQDVLINDASVASTQPRLYFGEASILAFGTSAWELVSHNAGPAQCCGQVNSCGNSEDPVSLGVVSGGTYDAGSGAAWSLVLPGVPATPSAGIL